MMLVGELAPLHAQDDADVAAIAKILDAHGVSALPFHWIRLSPRMRPGFSTEDLDRLVRLGRLRYDRHEITTVQWRSTSRTWHQRLVSLA
jgi:hypothetical protein